MVSPAEMDPVRNALPGAAGTEIAARALSLTAGASPEAVGELVTLAEGRRPPLEAARALFIVRLQRRSDDFAATRALCAVSAALGRIGWEMPSVPSRRPRRAARRADRQIHQGNAQDGRPENDEPLRSGSSSL
jgi:hypothetical protein